MKKSVIESLWLSGLALVSIVLVHWQFADSIKGIFGEIDLQLHDTYFVTGAIEVSLLVFLNLAFWVYLLKTFIQKFKNQASVWILLLVSIFLIFVTTWVIRILGMIEAKSSWNIIPTEGLPEGTPILTDYTYWTVNNFVIAYQFFQIVVLTACGINLGKNYRKSLAASAIQ